MSASSRVPYVALTPDRTHFGSDIPLARLDDVQRTPALRTSAEPGAHSDSLSSMRARWKSFSLRCVETFQNNTGLLLIAAAQAFSSTMSLLVKKLNSVDPPVPTVELICIRMIITWTCCVTYMSITKVPDPILGPKGMRLLLVVRGVCGFLRLFGSYYSLQYLSLSDATVLQFLSPMCTAVVGALVLKEDFKCSQALASVCSLIGVVLIARPAFLFGNTSAGSAISDLPVALDGRNVLNRALLAVTPADRLRAVGAAMIGVFGATGAYTSMRAVGKSAHPLHSVAAFSSQCVLCSTIAMLVIRPAVVLPTRIDWIVMLLAITFLGFGSQMLVTMGLQRETAGRGSMAIYIQIIFATVNDLIFFHSTPSVLSIIGTVIIMTSAIYVVLSKENSGARKRHASIAASQVDTSLEEGLLANQEDVHDAVEDDVGEDMDESLGQMKDGVLEGNEKVS